MVKRILFIILLTIVSSATLRIQATEWSYAWPTNTTTDKSAGFYNFGANYDEELTSMERSLNGVTWTATFDKGAKLTFLPSSGQAIGSPGALSSKFVMTSDGFVGKIKSVTVEARTKNQDSTVGISVGTTAYTCNGATTASITTTETTPIECCFTPADEGSEGTLTIEILFPNTTTVAYLRSVTVVYEEGDVTIQVPVISPASGSFDAPFSATITSANDDDILYTIDGSNPINEGQDYMSPIAIKKSCTLKAVARRGDNYSAVVEAKYVVRGEAGLLLTRESLEIELLEEDLFPLDNPNRVEPIIYSSSNSAIAYCDKYGHIYTYGLGECIITAKFAGNDAYYPQTLDIPVRVIAKAPLSNLTVTPGAGTYNTVVDVTITCDDDRAETIWYHIGDEPMTLDELGVLDDFKIHSSTTLNLTIDHDCVLSVQAMGTNVWSDPQFITYKVNLPLQANFSGPRGFTTIYRNGFDSLEEANEWNTSEGSDWKLTPDAAGLNDVPPFSSIDPDSKYSLAHYYDDNGDVSLVTSPDIKITENALLRFYALYNPIWIFNGNLELYICENVKGAAPVKIWDALLASQNEASDDIKWRQYEIELSAYAGKEVYFAYAYYLTDGDNIAIDNFEVIVPDENSTTVETYIGQPLTFVNLSTGNPDSYEWRFPGADPSTSNEMRPTVSYSKTGTYSVTLTVTRGDEKSIKTLTDYVIVKAQAPKAAISVGEGAYFSPEASYVVPLNTPITFTDNSVGVPTSYIWTLPGTDLERSSEREVTVKYLKTGLYDVDLTVSNDAGTSSTYIYGVKAGGESLIWNIPAADNDRLAPIDLSWYGYYGGTNWLGINSFAESFEAPAVEAQVKAVNVYFAKATAVSSDAEIKVALTRVADDGMPGEEIISTSLPADQLVDASETYNDPTTFIFAEPAAIKEAFFITISGFPNGSTDDGADDIAMYALRIGAAGCNTAYHLMEEEDDLGNPTGEMKWYAQSDDPTSFAVAPLIEYVDPLAAVIDIAAEKGVDAEAVYYTLQGIRVPSTGLIPGIYIRVAGDKAEKILVK